MPRRTESIKVGEDVYAMGSPLGHALSFSVTRGIVSGFREIDGVSLVQTDAGVNRGNSGGPLVDSHGRFVGVISWKAIGSGVEGIAFGVPPDVAFRRLSLEPGGETAAALLNAASVTPPTPPPPVEDTPDPIPGSRLSPPPPSAPTNPYRAPVQVGGLSLAGTGATIVVVTWSQYMMSTDMTRKQSDFERQRSWNDIGWVVLAIGSAAVGASFLLSDPTPARGNKGSPPTKPSPTVALHAAPGSASLMVRY